MTQQMNTRASANRTVVEVEVAVLDGAAAGLGAAVVLGRSRRSVAVIDDGQPRNAPADGVHGFLTRDEMSPLDLVASGRAEVEHYGAHHRRRGGLGPAGAAGGFEVGLADGGVVRARRLVVTTGSPRAACASSTV